MSSADCAKATELPATAAATASAARPALAIPALTIPALTISWLVPDLGICASSTLKVYYSGACYQAGSQGGSGAGSMLPCRTLSAGGPVRGRSPLRPGSRHGAAVAARHDL